MKGLGRIHAAAEFLDENEEGGYPLAIHHVMTRMTEDGQAVAEATDGYILARRPIEVEDGDVLGYLPQWVVKEVAGRGDHLGRFEAGEVHCRILPKRRGRPKVFTRLLDILSMLPWFKTDRILDAARPEPGSTTHVRVRLDARLLHRLQDAICDGVDNGFLELSLPVPGDIRDHVEAPIYVRGFEWKKGKAPIGEGLVMPITRDGRGGNVDFDDEGRMVMVYREDTPGGADGE